MAGIVLFKGIRILLVPLYTRFLSPSDYGILGTMIPLVEVLGLVARMGLEASILYYLFEERDDPERYRRTLGTIVVLMMGMGLAMSVLVLVGSPVLLPLVFKDSLGGIWPFAWVMAGMLVLSIPQQVAMTVYQAREMRVRVALINIGTFLLLFGLMMYQLVVKRSGALGQLLASVQLAAVLFLPFAAVVFVMLGKRLSYSAASARASLHYGTTLLPHMLALWTLNLSDRLIIARFSGLEAAGYYAFAYTCGMAMQMVVVSMQSVWGPVFLDVRRNRADAPAVLGRLASHWSLLLGLICAGGILFTPEIVRVVAAEKYWVATPYIVPILLAYLFNGLYTFPGLILQQMRRNTLVSICTGAAAACNIISNLIFVPRFGPMAAAWATTGAFALMTAFYYYFGMRLNPITIRWWEWMLGLAAAFLAVPLAFMEVSPSLLAAKILIVVLSAGVFVTFMGGPRKAWARLTAHL